MQIIKSLKQNKKGIILMALSSLCVCVGQLFWKLAAAQGLGILLCGFSLYIAGAGLMIIAYKFGRLSVLQPMISLNYVLTAILAYFALGEHISVYKLLGIAVIMVSVVLIGGSDDC